MANPLLLKSSIVLGLLNILSVEFLTVPMLYRVYVWICVTTSILNHGFTNYYLKALDRLAIAVFCIPDLAYVFLVDFEFLWLRLVCFSLFMLAVASFFSAKLRIAKANDGNDRAGNGYHFAAHLFITAEHIMMSCYFNQIERI